MNLNKFLDIFKAILEKLSLFLLLWKAKEEGKKDARLESLEETLKDVQNIKEAQKSDELRDAVDDMYNRDKL